MWGYPWETLKADGIYESFVEPNNILSETDIFSVCPIEIVGFVGGGGIGYLLQTYSSQAMWSEVGTIVVVIAFVVWFMDTASAYIREALK